MPDRDLDLPRSLSLSKGPEQATAIRPGHVFYDSDGRLAQLHGVGIQRIDGRFWAWGEDKSAGGTFAGISCYSSDDLATWTSEGHALLPSAAGENGSGELTTGHVVERPKVLYNSSTDEFVMFLHVDSADYKLASVGYATSPTPAGPYTYRGSHRPLGNESRDIGVYQEPDGTAYLLSEDRPNGLHIYRLADDYLSVTEVIATTVKDDHSHGYESPALIKVDDLYYLLGSDLTGWSTNDNKYATASSLAGPWSAWRDFAPVGSATFDSQISTVVTVEGTEQTSHIYIGDRWQRDDLFSSPPVWLPLSVGDGAVSLEWNDSWSFDPVTGRITIGVRE